MDFETLYSELRQLLAPQTRDSAPSDAAALPFPGSDLPQGSYDPRGIENMNRLMVATGASAADPAGLPSALAGLYSPEARDAWRGAYENEPIPYLAGQVAAPAAGMARMLGTAIRSAPITSTAGMTGVGLTAATDEAGSARLTRRQQRELEIERQRKEIESQAEERRRSSEQQMRAQESERAEKERRARELWEAEQAKSNAERPLRERYPTAMSFVQPVAAGAALLVPAALKAGGRMLSNAANSRWSGVADEAEAALRSGDTMGATLKASELAERVAAHEAPRGMMTRAGDMASSAAVPVTGGFANAEIGMMPSQIDYFTQPYGSRAHNEAKAVVEDPWEYAKRGGFGLGLGITGAKLGALYPKVEAPVARSKALSNALTSKLGDEGDTVGQNINRLLQTSAPKAKAENMLMKVKDRNGVIRYYDTVSKKWVRAPEPE